MTATGSNTVLEPGEGKALWFLGDLYVNKLTGDETGGAFAVTEMTIAPAPRGGAPLHIHFCQPSTNARKSPGGHRPGGERPHPPAGFVCPAALGTGHGPGASVRDGGQRTAALAQRSPSWRWVAGRDG